MTVAEGSPPKWLPQINFNIKHGNKRDIGWMGAFAPILQTNDTLTYIDFRFMADTNQDQEGNFGLGYRWLNPDMLSITGIYGYFDRRFSSFGNKYSQMTFGTEYLSTTWDYRGNIYVPESTTFTNKTNTYETKIENLNKFQKIETVTTHLHINKEIPLKGLDIEIGRSIYGVPKLRLYLGGYYFHGRKGLASIKGKQIRSTYAFNNIVMLQAEFRHDNVRKKNYYIGLEINIPINLNSGTDKRKKLSYIERRMTEAPIRDVDIVSQTVQKQFIDSQESRTIPASTRSRNRQSKVFNETTSAAVLDKSQNFNQNDSFFSGIYCTEIGATSRTRERKNTSRAQKKSQKSLYSENTSVNSYTQKSSHHHSGNCCAAKFTTHSSSSLYRSVSAQYAQKQTVNLTSRAHNHIGNCCQNQASKSIGSKVSPSQSWKARAYKTQLSTSHKHGAHCNHGMKPTTFHVHKTDILKGSKKISPHNKGKKHHSHHDHKNCTHHHSEPDSDLILEIKDDESANESSPIHETHLHQESRKWLRQ